MFSRWVEKINKKRVDDFNEKRDAAYKGNDVLSNSTARSVKQHPVVDLSEIKDLDDAFHKGLNLTEDMYISYIVLGDTTLNASVVAQGIVDDKNRGNIMTDLGKTSSDKNIQKRKELLKAALTKKGIHV